MVLVIGRLHVDGAGRSDSGKVDHSIAHILFKLDAIRRNDNASVIENMAKSFGPDNCVSLTRSELTGTCVIRAECVGKSISDVEFAFVCTNPDAPVPLALHSYGQGGFLPDETYDSGVECASCSVHEKAKKATGTQLLHASDEDSKEHQALVTTTGQVAKFGPGECVSAFRSDAGTCMIQTRCTGQSLSGYDVGVTCVDDTGDYTRYSFGNDAFLSEETFNTRIPCSECLGTGDEAHWSGKQRHALVPKAFVDDLNTVRSELRSIKVGLGMSTSEGAKASLDSEDAAAASSASTQRTAAAAGSSFWPWVEAATGLGASSKAPPSAKELHATTPKAAALAKAVHAKASPPVVIPLGKAEVTNPPKKSAISSLSTVLERAAVIA
jgi:hypothetical protein